MFDAFDDTPCTDCPHRKDDYCKFYKQQLEEITPGVYMPCMECDDEYAFSIGRE